MPDHRSIGGNAMKSLIEDSRRVRVVRNPWHIVKAKREEQPWLVICGYCPHEGGGGNFLSDLFGPPGRTLGYANTWDLAMAHARQHAVDHESSRCPTCQCIPELTLPIRELT